MEHSADPDRRKVYFHSPLAYASSIVVVLIVAAAYLSTATTSYGWWFDGKSLNLTPVKGLLTLSMIHEATTAISLEPIVTPTPTPQPTLVPTIQVIPTSQQAKPTATKPTAAVSMAEQLLTIVNQERQAQGLNTLALNSALSSAAQKYATQMQSQVFFSHTSPDGTTFVQRDAAAGYTNWTWLAENIAYGQQSAQEVMTSWMNSPNHRANILDPKARDLGVGYAPGPTPYWVQEFGAK